MTKKMMDPILEIQAHAFAKKAAHRRRRHHVGGPTLTADHGARTVRDEERAHEQDSKDDVLPHPAAALDARQAPARQSHEQEEHRERKTTAVHALHAVAAPARTPAVKAVKVEIQAVAPVAHHQRDDGAPHDHQHVHELHKATRLRGTHGDGEADTRVP